MRGVGYVWYAGGLVSVLAYFILKGAFSWAGWYIGVLTYVKAGPLYILIGQILQWDIAKSLWLRLLNVWEKTYGRSMTPSARIVAANFIGGQMNSDLQMSDGQYLAVLVSVNMYRTSSLCSLDQVPWAGYNISMIPLTFKKSAALDQ